VAQDLVPAVVPDGDPDWEDEGERSYAPDEVHPLTDEELVAILDGEISDALGGDHSEISDQIEQALDYYYGKPFGNEQVGRSKVILTDVADTIEWIMPSMMRMFFGGDAAVRYNPLNREDEEGARQASDYMNQTFLQQEEGFLGAHDWIKSALLQKCANMKVWYEELEVPEITQLRGLSDMEMHDIAADEEVEFIEVLEREDPLVVPPPPDAPKGSEPIEIPLYDVKVRRVEKKRRIRAVPIPPEEFLIARRETRMNDETTFACHVSQKSLSDLLSMGFDEDQVLSLPADDGEEFRSGRIARHGDDDESAGTYLDRADLAARRVWVKDCYIRVDYDGDGYTELRNAVLVGADSGELLQNDYTNFQPFASLCPIPMPHKYVGLSIADLVMDLQLIRSTLLRQMLDNIYLQNNTRHTAVEGMVELDDLLSSLPGGVVRVTAPGMVEPLVTQPLSPMAFNMLEHLEGVRETRTGITRYNQGMDAKSLNQTATGITSIMEAANARIELMARIFAETGFKRLFRLLLRLMVESPIKDQVVKLRGEWVPIDPATWNPNMDVQIQVGLGVGQAAQRVQSLMQIGELQNGMLSAGMGGMIVTPDNAYNMAHEIQVAMGFKTEDYFFTNPNGREPPPPKPDPAEIKAEADLKVAQGENQVDVQKLELEQLKLESEAALKRYELDLEAALKREKIQSDETIAKAKLEVELETARLDVEAAKENAKAAAKAKPKEGKKDDG
jgi:hypothetical protein